MHVEVEKNGRDDGALWNAEMNVSVGGQGLLE